MNIFLIEPDQLSAKLIARHFTQRLDGEISITYARDAASAISLAAKNKPDVVVLDIMLGEKSGFEFLHEFRSYDDWQEVPIIVQTFANEPLVTKQNLHWKHYKNIVFISKNNLTLDKLTREVKRRTGSYEAVS